MGRQNCNETKFMVTKYRRDRKKSSASEFSLSYHVPTIQTSHEMALQSAQSLGLVIYYNALRYNTGSSIQVLFN